MIFWTLFQKYSWIGILAIGLLLGWQWRDYQAQGEALEARNNAWDLLIAEQKKYTDEIARKDRQSASLENELERLRNAKPKIKVVEKEVSKPEYINCPVPASGLQFYNSAIKSTGSNTPR